MSFFDELKSSEPITPEAKKIGEYLTSAGFTVRFLSGIPIVKTPEVLEDKARLLRTLEEQSLPASIYLECVIVGPPS